MKKKEKIFVELFEIVGLIQTTYKFRYVTYL